MLTTPDSQKKAKEMNVFMSGKETAEEKKNFLLRNTISYLVWGPTEQAFYEENNPKNNALTEYLKTVKKVYTNKDFTVYQIEKR